MTELIMGSRGSKLAMAQAKAIADQVACDVEIKTITTRGDKIHDVALAKLEGKGFFTREIDDALLNGEIDFAVHSFKDVPTELPEGLTIAVVPKRESACDALVSNFGGLDDLPKGARVGTASLRRKAELGRLRPDLVVEDLRGNIDTRFRKAKAEEFDAVVVAEAGLKRMGYEDYIALDPKEFIPAAYQGALAITTRMDDKETISALVDLTDDETKIACDCERAFLTALQGGCQIPAGAYTEMDGEGNITLTGFISSVDGRRFLTFTEKCTLDSAQDIAAKLATSLLDSGGREILDEIRKGGD
jgi:hydroxymethylbilane synthase